MGPVGRLDQLIQLALEDLVDQLHLLFQEHHWLQQLLLGLVDLSHQENLVLLDFLLVQRDLEHQRHQLHLVAQLHH